MKKYLLLLAAFGLFFFAACSDDDDGDSREEPSIVATWELTAVTPEIPDFSFFDCPTNPEITFTGNGTTTWTLYDAENNCAEFSDTGTWEQNQNGTYTVSVPGFGPVTGTVTFSGSDQFNFSTTILSFPVVLTFRKIDS